MDKNALQSWLPSLQVSSHAGKYVPIRRSSLGQFWKQSSIAMIKLRQVLKQLVFGSYLNSGLFSCLSEAVFKQ